MPRIKDNQVAELFSGASNFRELEAIIVKARWKGELYQVIDREVIQALIDGIAMTAPRYNGSAGSAALLLGMIGDRSAIPELEKLMASSDGMDSCYLPCMAALALAQLGQRSERIFSLLAKRAEEHILSLEL